MNIIITLPEITWLDIYYGKKTILLRSQYPRKFDVTNDHIYVCDEFTKLVVGYFDLTVVGKIKDCYLWYKLNGRGLNMPWQGYKRYCDVHRSTYAMFINNAVRFQPAIPLSNFHASNKAPRTFYYTDFEIW